MRHPARIEPLLARLAELWKTSPDLRLGQLLVNVTGERAPRLFYIEDGALVAALEQWLAVHPAVERRQTMSAHEIAVAVARFRRPGASANWLAMQELARTAESFLEVCELAPTAFSPATALMSLGINAGQVAIAAACILLRSQEIAIESNLDPHDEMCAHLDLLEAQGRAPAGAAAILRAWETRYAAGDVMARPQLLELLQLVLDFGKAIGEQDAALRKRVAKWAERLAAAIARLDIKPDLRVVQGRRP